MSPYELDHENRADEKARAEAVRANSALDMLREAIDELDYQTDGEYPRLIEARQAIITLRAAQSAAPEALPQRAAEEALQAQRTINDAIKVERDTLRALLREITESHVYVVGMPDLAERVRRALGEETEAGK